MTPRVETKQDVSEKIGKHSLSASDNRTRISPESASCSLLSCHALHHFGDPPPDRRAALAWTAWNESGLSIARHIASFLRLEGEGCFEASSR